MIQYTLYFSLKFVAEVVPLKQGLKHVEPVELIKQQQKVAEVVPLKQGLKLLLKKIILFI